MHKAASRGHESVVQLLLRHTVEINKPDQNGYTALHRAAEGKNGKVALLLLENKGVDFDAKTAAGETFFDVLGQEIPEPESGVFEALKFTTGKEVCLAAKATANDKARDAAALDHRLSRRSAVALLLKWMTHKEIEAILKRSSYLFQRNSLPDFSPLSMTKHQNFCCGQSYTISSALWIDSLLRGFLPIARSVIQSPYFSTQLRGGIAIWYSYF